MQITNIQFTKLVKIGERLREFNFRKAPGTVNSYHIDVTDERGKRIMFTLAKDDAGVWQSLQPLPLWLEASVNTLASIIESES